MTPAIQQVLMDAWEEHVDDARQLAAEAQARAKETLVRKGVKIVAPDIREVEKWRHQLLPFQAEFVQALHIDPELVKLVDKVLNAYE